MKRKVLIVLLAALLLLSLFLLGGRSRRQVFHLGDKPGAMPFSPAILVDDTLYISGQLAVRPDTGEFENGTMAQQSERVIANIGLLLKKAGLDLGHVVSATVYISDFKEFGEFNEVFRKFFPKDPPTRATVQVSRLARDARIEISAIAVK
ncbi:MAG TPA: Rid family detoxifying hydrolase [Patescibacteria group bacterium]|nr:Rid family detoxifying hydrolase [Patescibacteria group bacterium]